MQDFAIGGQGDGARLVDCHADFIAGDFAGARSEADAAVAVYATHVGSRGSDECVLDCSASGVLGLYDCFLNCAGRLLHVNDEAFARAARFCDAVPAIAQTVVGNFCNQHAGLGTAYINRRQKIGLLVRHRYG